MHEKTPQEYANELLQMYKANAQAIADANPFDAQKVIANKTSSKDYDLEDGVGGLLVNTTTLNQLYPVANAFITVFTDDQNGNIVIETDTTDESGKSDVFKLKTPSRSESQQSDNAGVLPYTNYNISVTSDGYVEKIIKNIPVFSGVVSVQGVDLLPIATAGKNTKPETANQENNYNL